MRLISWALGLAFFSAVFAQADADVEDGIVVSDGPEVTVTASFPEDNPFGQVVNGERNRINLIVENASELNVTVVSVAGSFHDARTNDLIKNTTTLPYGLRLLAGTKVQLPYSFHSEFKPGDIRLSLWLTHAAQDEIYRVPAYDSVVTVVEPEVSIFHYQVITTYLFTAAFLGGLGYFAYKTFGPKPKRSRKPAPKKEDISAPTGNVTVTGAGGYEEEWIPVHHLKLRRKKNPGLASSGEELSTGETSGTEGKKRKGRK